MTMTEIPPGLRDAFGERAADIPDDYGAVMLTRIGRRPRTPGARVLAAAATATLAVALAGSALALADRQPTVGVPLLGGSAAGGSSSAPAAAGALELAGYRFALPADFVPANESCLPDLGVPEIAFAPAGSSAESPAGGCLSIALVPGSALPSGARDVTVNGRRAHLLERPDGLVLLFVEGTGPSPRAVLLAARGLTADQLIGMARAAVR